MSSIIIFTYCSKWNHDNGQGLTNMNKIPFVIFPVLQDPFRDISSVLVCVCVCVRVCVCVCVSCVNAGACVRLTGVQVSEPPRSISVLGPVLVNV